MAFSMLSKRTDCFWMSELMILIYVHGGIVEARAFISATDFLAALTWSSKLIFCWLVSYLQAVFERLNGGIRELDRSKTFSLSEIMAFSSRITFSEMSDELFTFESKSLILLMRLFT